jgi:hypothetical protein
MNDMLYYLGLCQKAPDDDRSTPCIDSTRVRTHNDGELYS